MTNREFYEAIMSNNVNEEVIAFATEALAKLDTANAKRRERVAEKSVAKEAEKAPIREALVAILGSEPKTASMLIAESGLEITPQSIPVLFKGLIAEGVIAKMPVKVKGKGSQVGYVKA